MAPVAAAATLLGAEVRELHYVILLGGRLCVSNGRVQCWADVW